MATAMGSLSSETPIDHPSRCRLAARLVRGGGHMNKLGLYRMLALMSSAFVAFGIASWNKEETRRTRPGPTGRGFPLGGDLEF